MSRAAYSVPMNGEQVAAVPLAARRELASLAQRVGDRGLAGRLTEGLVEATHRAGDRLAHDAGRAPVRAARVEPDEVEVLAQLLRLGRLGHPRHDVHPGPAGAAGVQEERPDATGPLRRQPVHRQLDRAGLRVPVVQRDGVRRALQPLVVLARLPLDRRHRAHVRAALGRLASFGAPAAGAADAGAATGDPGSSAATVAAATSPAASRRRVGWRECVTSVLLTEKEPPTLGGAALPCHRGCRALETPRRT